MWRRLALWLVCVSLATHASATATAGRVEEKTFAYVKANSQQPRLTLFYFASDAESRSLLPTLDASASYLASVGLEKLASFEFVRVNCEASANSGECTEAGFKPGTSWLFTSTPQEGIQPFSGTRDVASIVTHVRHKFLPFDTTDVKSFVDEASLYARLDAPSAKPIVMKFWESWCTHCKALKLPYDQAATFFRDQVEFMEIECSRDAGTKAFCEQHKVASYPTLLLFDGEEKHAWNDFGAELLPDKSIVSFQKFFLASLPVERFTKQRDREGESLPPPPTTPTPSSSTRSESASAKQTTSSIPAKEATKSTDSESKPKKKKQSNKRVVLADEDDEPVPRRKRSQSARHEDDDDSLDEFEPRHIRLARRARTEEEANDEDSDDNADEPRKLRRTSSRRSHGEDDDDEDQAPKKRKSKTKRRRAEAHDEL